MLHGLIFTSIAFAIVGGQPSQVGSAVAIYQRNAIGENVRCTGVLISPRTVLTPEHCATIHMADLYSFALRPSDGVSVIDVQPDNLGVYVGPGVASTEEVKLSVLPERVPLHKVTKITRHPRCSECEPAGTEPTHIDLTILTLAEDVKEIVPAELPSESIFGEATQKAPLLNVGFGNQLPNSVPEAIRGVKMEYAPAGILNQGGVFSADGKTDNLFKVAMPDGLSTESVDSGAPLYSLQDGHFIVIGLVQDDFISIFENLDWIRANLR